MKFAKNYSPRATVQPNHRWQNLVKVYLGKSCSEPLAALWRWVLYGPKLFLIYVVFRKFWHNCILVPPPDGWVDAPCTKSWILPADVIKLVLIFQYETKIFLANLSTVSNSITYWLVYVDCQIIYSQPLTFRKILRLLLDDVMSEYLPSRN